MRDKTVQSIAGGVWALARGQHWVVTRQQLLALGFSPKAIKDRIADGRLHPIYRGVYAVGRPQLTRLGGFMAAVLACGVGAVLSHASAGELFAITGRAVRMEVSVPARRRGERQGITVNRRCDVETG